MFVNLVSGIDDRCIYSRERVCYIFMTYKTEFTCKVLWNYLFIYVVISNILNVHYHHAFKVERKRPIFGNLKNPNGKSLDLWVKIPFAQKLFLGNNRFYTGQF